MIIITDRDVVMKLLPILDPEGSLLKEDLKGEFIEAKLVTC